MKDPGLMGLLVSIVATAVVIVFMVWYSFYKYHDCLKVGHSRTYCVLDFGS